MYFPGTRAYAARGRRRSPPPRSTTSPGRFTAFIGYEWTSNTGGNNLHRNVIFRDNGDKASQVEPFTVYPPFGSDNPVELWKWMDAYEKKTGGSVLAIAHNGNLSNGLMFPMVEAFGKKLDREYAETRAKWERLYETTQTKGDGETHPFLSPNDEFADFELWDKGNLDGSVAKKKEMLEFEYARSALKNGLKLEQQLGTNPYKFGMVGSSDAHTGLAAMEEDNFFGKTDAAGAEPGAPDRHLHQQPEDRREDHGLGGLRLRLCRRVGHGEHARGALGRDAAQGDLRDDRPAHDRALLRRLGLRGGATRTNRIPASVGYTKGVPMGGDLREAPAGKAPTFLVAALKDPIGANLDRIQIVKGWLDAKGELHEKVYDVVWSGDRKPDAKTASCRPWAAPWTSRTRPGPTRSARPS